MKCEILGQDIRIDERLAEYVNDKLATCRDRFGHRIRQMTVSLYDVDGPRAGVDKRCRISFRLAGAGQSVVEAASHDWTDAIAAAIHRAETAIGKRLDRSRTQHQQRIRRSQEVLWVDYDPKLPEEITQSRLIA